MAPTGQTAAQAVQPVQSSRRHSAGASRPACLPARAGAEAASPPGRPSDRPKSRRARRRAADGPRRSPWGVHRFGGVQTDDASGAAQPGEQAVNAGIGGLPPFAGRHGGEERLLELEGEDRPMEGVGDYGGGVLKQAQKFLGARVKDQPRGAVDLPPCARQLEDRPAGCAGTAPGRRGRASPGSETK